MTSNFAKIVALAVAICGLAACDHLPDAYAKKAPRTIAASHPGLPSDVTDFMSRRSSCDHFRNEDMTGGDRNDFLAEQSSLYCSGTDAELAGLREKYAADPGVIEALRSFEASIE